MEGDRGPNQPITITLERWRWEQVLQCLDRYVAVLRGDDANMLADIEWANQLDAMTDEFRMLIYAGGNEVRTDEPESDRGSPIGIAEEPKPFEHQTQAAAESNTRPGWSTEENKAVVETYFWMLDELEAGRDVNKAATYRTLREGPLRDRSSGAIESKMQNISAILDRHGLAFVPGLKPRVNVQNDLVIAVEAHLDARRIPDQAEPPHR